MTICAAAPLLTLLPALRLATLLATLLALSLSLSMAPPADAQEFAIPSSAVARGAGDLLERALPPAHAGVTFDALHTRLPLGLTGRALLASAGAGALRFGLGAARTGEAELGWSTAAAACGLAGPRGGAALRVLARRDDPAGEPRDGLEGAPRDGFEAGAGAWVGERGWRAWMSVPQARTQGLAPPLARGLTLGGEFEAQGLTLSLEREAPRAGFAEDADWSGRVALAVGGLALWGEARERPWRGGIGVAACAGALRIAAEVDGHPVLEPTVRLSAGAAFGRGAP